MKHITKIIVIASLFSSLVNADNNRANHLPKLQMPDNNLTFEMIEGYQDYKKK